MCDIIYETVVSKNGGCLMFQNAPDSVIIEQHHLQEALRGTRPSLAATDLEKYTQMYVNVPFGALVV